MKEMDGWLETGEPLEAHFTARTVGTIPPPSQYEGKRIASLRRRLGASQTVFAQLIGASAPLVRAWERGGRRPSAMARRLLDEIDREPDRWAMMLLAAEPAA
jgi:DNA-binding transcriptional regulator YiaG